jgi:hypothetical protein
VSRRSFSNFLSLSPIRKFSTCPTKWSTCHLVPFGPLKEHPLGFFLGAFSEIDLDLFNQGSDFRRRYFEG